MSKRISWIDCAKFIAVIAVAVDHCSGVLYTSRLISYASYFSVSLFILLSGISTWISYENGKDITFYNQFQKVIRIFGLYAMATFVVLCVTEKRFILKTYLEYLLSFNIQGPYYYLVFFVQLLMIAPVFVSWCKFANSKKFKWFIQLGTLGVLGWFAYISINYTYILHVHGGGKFLGGGTYVILYYLGMVLASNGAFRLNKKKRGIVAVICFGVAVLWAFLMAEGKLEFDQWMSPYWGNGMNPPSVNFMVYAIVVLFACYSIFSLLDELQYSLVRKMIRLFSFFGKNTIYIWLYHLLVRNIIIARLPNILEEKILVRVIVFIVIVILPAIVKQLLSGCYRIYQKQMQ